MYICTSPFYIIYSFEIGVLTTNYKLDFIYLEYFSFDRINPVYLRTAMYNVIFEGRQTLLEINILYVKRHITFITFNVLLVVTFKVNIHPPTHVTSTDSTMAMHSSDITFQLLQIIY